jgi:hypothetical protein
MRCGFIESTLTSLRMVKVRVEFLTSLKSLPKRKASKSSVNPSFKDRVLLLLAKSL